MNIIRVFPRKTKWTPDDKLSFIGDPPLFKPSEDLPVFISCAFTWDVNECERLYQSWSKHYSDVQLGGPAFGDPGGDFEPGMFLKPGITITSRGCPKDCPWCFVPSREGCIRELPIMDGWIVQDNNLLACSFDHVRRVFEMLSRQPHPVSFHGGLDTEFLTEKHVELFKSIRFNELWFACDHLGAIKNLEKAAEILTDFSMKKKRCYVLVGFDGETITQAEKRLLKVCDLGFLPFAIPYQGETFSKDKYNRDWRKLIKTFCRPAATMSHLKRLAKTENHAA